MVGSQVLFSDLRASSKVNLLDKIETMLQSMELKEIIHPRALVAIKVHFGERGNLAYVRPQFIRKVVEYVKELGGKPFITDTNTLYAGTRGDSVSHMRTAVENGFTYSVIGAPVIIADGLRGASYSRVRVNLDHIDIAYIGKEIAEADAVIGVAHFKGHELAGFGGAIKNIGMGCASRRGKMEQHSDLAPRVSKKKCERCGDCAEHCSQKAIIIGDQKAEIDSEKCIGCGECILICPNRAIDVNWGTDNRIFQKKMVEYAHAVLKDKAGRYALLNFLTNISPACDCYPFNDAPFVEDIGVLASRDPVALDQASVDLVNEKESLDNCCLKSNISAGQDKFRALYPQVDWTVQLQHAERLKLGTGNIP